MTLYSNLTGAQTTMMVFIVNDTELPWRHPMDSFLCMNYKAIVARHFQRGGQIAWGVTDLEGNLLREPA